MSRFRAIFLMKLDIYKRLNFHLHKFHTRTCFFQCWEPCRLCSSWHRLVRHSLDIVRHRTVRFVPVWRDECIIAVQHICVPWLLGAKTLANSFVWCLVFSQGLLVVSLQVFSSHVHPSYFLHYAPVAWWLWTPNDLYFLTAYLQIWQIFPST